MPISFQGQLARFTCGMWLKLAASTHETADRQKASFACGFSARRAFGKLKAATSVCGAGIKCALRAPSLRMPEPEQPEHSKGRLI